MAHLQLVSLIGDEALMASVQAGQREAFSQLVPRHVPGVHRFCTKMVGASMADELMQETFTNLWRGRGQYRPPMPFASYLYSIAANACRSHHRGQGRRERFLKVVTDQPHHEPATPEAALELVGEIKRVHEALGHLPEAQREAVILRFSAELDSEALGEALGCNASTARSRVFFGLQKLRELLGATV